METLTPSQPNSASSAKWRNISLLILGLIIIGSTISVIIANQSQLDNSAGTDQDNPQASPTAQVTATPSPTPTAQIECGQLASFANKEMGLSFCYPQDWGVTSIIDARVAETDTGHRQSIIFSNNPLVSVGGQSQDWSTTVGRGGSCLEPNNAMPQLSSYNTEWHNIQGEGMAVSFAQRSLPSSQGGYTIVETVSDNLQSGVCVHGHKAINGSRYRIAFAGFSRDFSQAAGITSPRAHMDNPSILFSLQLREQFNSLMASLTAY